MALHYITDADVYNVNDTLQVDCEGYSLLYLYFPNTEEPDYLTVYPTAKDADPFLADLMEIARHFPTIKIQALNCSKYPSVVRVLRRIQQPRLHILPSLLLCFDSRIVLKYDDFSTKDKSHVCDWLTIHVPSTHRRIKF